MADSTPTTDEKPDEPYFLTGDEAMELWRSGREKWNAWTASHPDAIVSFFGAEFEANDRGLINFTGFKFPAGEGFVTFFRANFGEGNVSFGYANFGEGDVNFSNAKFGEGIVHFFGANFGEGNVNFSNANFGEGDVSFSNAKFGEGIVNFQNCIFAGAARFEHLENVENCRQFTFEGTRFDQLFHFSHKGILGCPLDLRRTKLTHDVVVNDIHCTFAQNEKPKWWHPRRLLPPKATDQKDSQRFRRLKELAISNRNHAKALEFHVQEIETRRGTETVWWQDCLQTLFWWLGNYGRSIFRPFFWLCALWVGFAAIFWCLRKPIDDFTLEKGETLTRSFFTALTYSGSNLLSFIPNGRTARSQGQERLFGDITPDIVLGLGALESIIAIVLLFLFGLALRNQFRI